MIKMTKIQYSDLDATVDQLRAANLDVYLDGWDIVHFTPNPRAEFSQKGVIRATQFGYITRYSPSSAGTWDIRGIFARAHKR